MERRDLLKALSVCVGVASGCTNPAADRPTGELDVAFETRAEQSYVIRLQLVDADGQTVEEFESAFPPDQGDAPSFYAGGLSNGPYSVAIETETDRQEFEWTVTDDCRRLDVTVTVLEDGRLEYESRCSSPEGA